MINKINWYPGHMKKATDILSKNINQVDLVIEVLDARCIKGSSNHDLSSIIKNKPIIQIALKNDLSDITSHNNVLLMNTKEIKYKKILINEMYKKLEQKINNLKNKGLICPQFSVMVVGLPNVGKSTLINFLSPKKTLIAQNKAGVTKKQATRKINDNFWLIDNPGIFLKNINTMELGYQLALINCINKEILPIAEVNAYYHKFMQDKYWEAYSNFFSYNKRIEYSELVELIAKKHNYILNNQEIDENKVNNYLFNLYVNAKICRYHFND